MGILPAFLQVVRPFPTLGWYRIVIWNYQAESTVIRSLVSFLVGGFINFISFSFPTSICSIYDTWVQNRDQWQTSSGAIMLHWGHLSLYFICPILRSRLGTFSVAKEYTNYNKIDLIISFDNGGMNKDICSVNEC